MKKCAKMMSRILAVILVVSMIVTNVVPSLAQNIDQSTKYPNGLLVDGSTGWNSAGGDQYLLEGDFDVTITFENAPFIRDTNNWSNFVFELIGGDKTDGITLRADAYGWNFLNNQSNPNNLQIPTYLVTTTWGSDWDSFKTLCNNYKTINLTVQKTSNYTVTATIVWGDYAGVEKYTITYPEGVPETMRVQVGADGGKVTIYEFKDNTDGGSDYTPLDPPVTKGDPTGLIENLIGYYTFDETLENSEGNGSAKLHGGAGDTWNSSVTGTVHYSDGKNGQAYEFLGDVDGVRGEGLELDVLTSEAFTIGMWVNTKQKLNYQPILFAVKDQDNYVTAGTNYNDFASGGIVNYKTIWHWLDRNAPVSSSTLKDIPLNTWVYITFSITEDGNATLYYNGEILGQRRIDAYEKGYYSGLPIFLGINWWNESFAGLIDDVTVYNTALTADEVTTLYRSNGVPGVAAEYEASGELSSSLTHVSVHDPSIIKDPDTGRYYIFGSHMAWAYSDDLMNWKTFTNNINTDYEDLFATEKAWSAKNDASYKLVDPAAATNLWAPDVIWNENMGKWCMYMSINGNTWNSTICLLTADHLDGDWTYVGPVIQSGMSRGFGPTFDYEKVTGTTDVSRYTSQISGNAKTPLIEPHAIDPCVTYDDAGGLWMSYGSWSGGIGLIKLDNNTGLRDYSVTYEDKSSVSDPYTGYKISGGYGKSGEASYIEKIGNYYYLYVTYGGFSATGGYNMRVFRSENITGPYRDMSGDYAVYPMQSGDTGSRGTGDNGGSVGMRLMSYYKWSYMDVGYTAQGHNSSFVDEDGKAYVVYHTRFNDGTEGHQVRVHQLFVTEDGWLAAAPFEYAGETLNPDIKDKDVAGTYEVLIHTSDIDYANLECVQGISLVFGADGTVSGDKSGTWAWSKEKPNVIVTLDGVTYKGVFLEQQMESADFSTTTTVTLVGSNELSVWGYKQQSEIDPLELYVYYEDYNNREDTGWTSPNAQDSLSIKNNGDVHRGYLDYAADASQSGNRGAYHNFPVEANLSGEYIVEADIKMTPGTVAERSVSQFAITGTDASYDSGNYNNGIVSGYILKLSTQEANSTTYYINDSEQSVTIPSNTWVHVKAVVSNGTDVRVSITIGNDTKTFTTQVNGSGVLKGLYLLRGRGYGAAAVDNIAVTAPHTVTLYSSIEDGSATSIVNLTGGGTYYRGSAVTVTCPEVDGYTFLGWYAASYNEEGEFAGYEGSKAGSRYSYTFTVDTEDVGYVAVYDVKNTQKNLKVEGNNFSVDGVGQTSTYTGQYSVGTTVTLVATGSEFLYWMNESDKIVSTSEEYTIIIVDDAILYPVYKGSSSAYAIVEYVSAYGQVLLSGTYTSNQTITPPAEPSKLGYTFSKWSLTPEEIKGEIQKGETYIRVEPEYTEDNTTYMITIYNGDGTYKTDTAAVGDVYDVTAEEISGKTFSHWASDENGKHVLSYQTTYSFRVSGDVTLYAIYVAAAETVEKKPVIAITNMYASTVEGKNKISFEATRSVPDDYEVLETGILISTVEVNGMSIGVSGVQKVISSSKSNNGIYTLNVNVTGKESATVYARGYMIVRKKGSDDAAIETFYTEGVSSSCFNELNAK